MNVLDLFSGIGGFSLAAHRAGFEVVAHCEIENFPRAVLKHRFPNIPIFDDVRTLTKEKFYEITGQSTVDIVCGGSPCQDFSVAGLQRGFNGNRSCLFVEQVRIARELGAKFIVWENVPGVLSSNKGRDFERVLCNGRDAYYNVSPTLRSMCGNDGNNSGGGSAAVCIAENIIGRKVENGGNGVGAQENVSYTLNTVGVHGVAYTQNQVGEIHEDNIAPTLNTNSNASGRNVPILPDNLGLRRLTPRECERLQGFPDDWTKIPYRGKDLSICPDSPRYKACGNAVTVAVAEWVLKRLVNEVK